MMTKRLSIYYIDQKFLSYCIVNVKCLLQVSSELGLEEGVRADAVRSERHLGSEGWGLCVCVRGGICVCDCVCVCVVCVHVFVSSCLATKVSISKYLATRRVVVSVGGPGEWVGIATAYKFVTCTFHSIHDLIKVHVKYTCTSKPSIIM